MQSTFIAIVIFAAYGLAKGNSLYELEPQNRDVGLATCEKIYGLMAYPRVIKNITVLRTSPLRVRVYLLAQGPSKSIPFSVEGMVCQVGFDQNAANAACRSQNFHNAVMVTDIAWHEPPASYGQQCIMDTESYKSVIPCEYILHQLSCPASATNLVDCRFPPLFSQSLSCNAYTHQEFLREVTSHQEFSPSQTMHLHFNPSILDYIHLTPPSWSITTISMKFCAILFSLLDFDKTNHLEEYHIHALLIYLTNISKNQTSTLFYKLDLDRSGAMELEEFFILISLLIANKDKKEKEFMHAHSKTVFELLDDDSSGSITVEEFQRLGYLFNLDNREIRIIFKDFDVSGDDALDYSEFCMFTLACINKQKLMKKK
ncbi:unnamed protein product, partial [Adineta ricciae]